MTFNLNQAVEIAGSQYVIVSNLIATTGDACALLFSLGDKNQFLVLTVEELTESYVAGKLKKIDLPTLDFPENIETTGHLKLEQDILDLLAACGGDYRKIFSYNKERWIVELENEIIRKFGFSRKTLLRKIARYLKSGRNVLSLCDTRSGHRTFRGGAVRGRKMMLPDEFGELQAVSSKVTDDKLFTERVEWARAQLNKNPLMTVDSLYNLFLENFYSYVDNGVLRLPSEDQYPSIERFRRKLNLLMGKTIHKHGKTPWEIKNNYKPNDGTASYNVSTIGQVFLIDECELDIDIVAEDEYGNYQNIGSPVVYLIVDSFSHLITGYYVGLDNNSYCGFLNCFETLLYNKSEILPYGIGNIFSDIDKFCPGKIIPNTLLSDHGSEYISKTLRESLISAQNNSTFRFLGIEVRLAAVGVGRSKGLVERKFGILQQHLSSSLKIDVGQKNRGGYTRLNKATAKLTIEQMWKMVTAFVRWSNITPLEKYPDITEDMKGVELSPVGIWKFCLSERSPRRVVTPPARDELYFSLLPERNFTLSKDGLSAGGLYFVPCKKLQSVQTKNLDKAIPITGIRYDPRSVRYVYLLEGAKLIKMSLNKKHGKQLVMYEENWDWKRAADLLSERKVEDRISKSIRRENKLNLQSELREIVATETEDRRAGTKDIKLYRAAAKEKAVAISSEIREKNFIESDAEKISSESSTHVAEGKVTTTPEPDVSVDINDIPDLENLYDSLF